ncbi:transcriptional regulator TACO1-like protein [Phlyctochytrium arcticum]|nr:transcriptional regulator TACO1-like protein [Phlyctochytrium arcticum]
MLRPIYFVGGKSWTSVARDPRRTLGLKLDQQVRNAGHNKWSKIKRAKGANDLQRANNTAKITRQIISAVKAGGGELDPGHNFYLSAALELARRHQVPKATLEAALKKASGKGATDEILHSCTYEGMGPHNTALIIETLTNNKNRTFADVRTAFTKGGGAMTPVQYLFQKQGRLTVAVEEEERYVEELEEAAIDAGALEIEESPDGLDIYTEVTDLQNVRKHLEKLKYTIVGMEIVQNASDKNEVDLAAWEETESFIDRLESLDDVVKIFHNSVPLKSESS